MLRETHSRVTDRFAFSFYNYQLFIIQHFYSKFATESNTKSMDSDKQLYIISGCNGAGKTTASYTVLPEVLQCKEFVNADEIARGLSPFNPANVAIEAGRLMLQRIDELLKNKENFSIETTLATRSYIRLVNQAQKQGYKVSLIYFWLNSPELAVERVAQRVSNGGHDIPKETVLRRYQAGINNLFDIYMPQVDYWLLADNSHTPRVIVAEGGRDMATEVHDVKLFNTIQNYVK